MHRKLLLRQHEGLPGKVDERHLRLLLGLILGGDKTPLSEYQPGTWGPQEADRLAADIGGWHDPKASGEPISNPD